jgi:hypothetical protein
MATAEDRARLIVEAEARGFAEADAKIKATEAALDDLGARYKSGSVELLSYVQADAGLRHELSALRGSYDLATTAVKKHGTTQAAAASLSVEARGKMKNFGYAVLEFSRGIEDMQYGLVNAQNNIPGLIQRLGGGAGLAGAISLVVVGIGVALPKIKEFWDSFNSDLSAGAFDTIKSLKDKIEEIEEHPIRMAVDQLQLDEAQRKLDRLTKAKAELDAQMGQQNAHEAESGAKINEAIKESATGSAGVVAKVAEAIERKNVGDSIPIQEATEAQKKAVGRIGQADQDFRGATDANDRESANAALREGERARAELHAAKEKESAARTAIEQASKLDAAGLIADARKGAGDTQADAQSRLTAWLVAVGEKALAASIKDASPANVKTKKEDADAKKLATEAARKAAEGLKQTQADQIGILTRSNALDNLATALAKEANKEGKDAVLAFEGVRDAIGREILDHLQQRGISTEGATDEAARAASGIADQAFGRVGREGLKGVKDEGRKQVRDAAEVERGRKVQVELDRADARPRLDAERESIKAGGLVQKAQALMDQVRRRGGAEDDHGRFRKLDKDQQFDYVQGKVAEYLHRPEVDEAGNDRINPATGKPVRINRGMDADRTRDVSTAITAEARQAFPEDAWADPRPPAGTRRKGRGGGPSREGVPPSPPDNTQAVVGALGAQQGTMQQLNSTQARQAQELRRLQQAANQTKQQNRGITQQQPSLLGIGQQF